MSDKGHTTLGTGPSRTCHRNTRSHAMLQEATEHVKGGHSLGHTTFGTWPSHISVIVSNRLMRYCRKMWGEAPNPTLSPRPRTRQPYLTDLRTFVVLQDGAEDAKGAPQVNGRTPVRFMPFSMGGRDCVGQTLAKLNLATTLAQLYGTFTFKLADEVSTVHSFSWVSPYPHLPVSCFLYSEHLSLGSSHLADLRE